MYEESDFMETYDDTITPTLELFLDQFNTMVGNDLFNDDDIIDANLNAFINYISSVGHHSPTQLHQQSYILFVVAICIVSRVGQYDESEFYEKYYFPVLYSMLSKQLGILRRLLSQHDSKIYDHIEDKASDVIGFSLTVYNLSASVIKVDTRKIFLKTFFIETSPCNIPDLHSYYYLQLQYIYYEYIKNKTQGLIPIDELIGLQQNNTFTSYSRSSIYEFGIRNHRIKTMCSNSETLQAIDKNYDKLRDRILPNQFITLFKQSTGMTIHDSKTATVYLNSMKLDDLEDEFPLICKLLRSIHIASDSDIFTDQEKISIRDNIFITAKNKLEPRVGSVSANKIASGLATTISSDLVSGEYIDPRTMTRIKLSSNVFITQFQKFLNKTLDSLIGSM